MGTGSSHSRAHPHLSPEGLPLVLGFSRNLPGRADDTAAAESIRKVLCPLPGSALDYDPLMDWIGDARYVLLGEASHGTREFYEARADITMQLLRQKGFNAVVVEADWPD